MCCFLFWLNKIYMQLKCWAQKNWRTFTIYRISASHLTATNRQWRKTDFEIILFTNSMYNNSTIYTYMNRIHWIRRNGSIVFYSLNLWFFLQKNTKIKQTLFKQLSSLWHRLYFALFIVNKHRIEVKEILFQ